jgi:hypothetical protein
MITKEVQNCMFRELLLQVVDCSGPEIGEQM